MAFVPVAADPSPLPEALRDQVTVDVIHDGDSIPEEYLVGRDGRPLGRDALDAAFVRERDWGANLVAERLAARLGLPGFTTVQTARVLLDFGRFPGVSRTGAPHLRRAAINEPFHEALSFGQQRRLLEEHYDEISRAMDRTIRGKLLKIAVHTYDRHNPSGTERPQVSVVSRALGYQLDGELPYGVFDPLYPDILAEFTVDRVLPSRISLVLERAGVPVAHNYPYLLPEGSVEVRHQVWCFFDWLQARYEAEHPEVEDDPAWQMVWGMLKDTNLRSGEAGMLRAFIHRFRRPPVADLELYQAAEHAYRQLERALAADGGSLVAEYRHSPDRAMSFGVEVRKDMLWRFDAEGRPVEPSPEAGLYIADKLADAIVAYLLDDRCETGARAMSFHRTGRWYGPGGSPTK
jgi:hypothetical protein